MNEYLKGSLGDALISLAITGVFLLVAGALLALFGSFGALPSLGAGFGLLWVCVLGAALLAAAITRLFRLNPHDTFARFLGLHLLSTVPIMLGWSAFARVVSASVIEPGGSAMISPPVTRAAAVTLTLTAVDASTVASVCISETTTCFQPVRIALMNAGPAAMPTM